MAEYILSTKLKMKKKPRPSRASPKRPLPGLGGTSRRLRSRVPSRFAADTVLQSPSSPIRRWASSVASFGLHRIHLYEARNTRAKEHASIVLRCRYPGREPLLLPRARVQSWILRAVSLPTAAHMPLALTSPTSDCRFCAESFDGDQVVTASMSPCSYPK